jgi:tryptophan synthase alpha chain
LKRHTGLPIAVGFGIKTAEQAQAIAKVADAAVVGSALVSKVGENVAADGTASSKAVDDTLALVRELAAGVRRARQ